MTEHAARERAALWAALALILVWGANFSVQKAVFEALSPGGFLFVRYLIMPVAAALLLVAHYGTKWPKLPRRELLALLKLGVAGHLLHVGLVTYGIHWSTAFSSSLILACGPVFTLLILRWHGIEHFTRGQLVGVNRLGFSPANYIRNTVDFITAGDVVSGLVKAAVFGFIVALMGCYQGYHSKGGAQGVGAATTRAVVSASILILVANYVVTELFFSR